jgi:AICAR transformylase/IMP cyclohydrolase PurH
LLQKFVKTKSNTIVFAKAEHYIIGTGQTSRVDALMQAIEKKLKLWI